MNAPQSILVVDDVKSYTDSTAERFRRDGWDAEAAYTGQGAVDAILKRSFDVILLDMKLPLIGDGFKAIADLLTVRADACIVFLSGQVADMANVVMALQAGATSMLDKAYGFERIRDLVRVAYAIHQKRLADRVERDNAISNAANATSALQLAMGLGHQIRGRIAEIGIILELAEHYRTYDEILKFLHQIPEALGDIHHAIGTLHQLGRLRHNADFDTRTASLADTVRTGVHSARRPYRTNGGKKVIVNANVSDNLSVMGDTDFLAHAVECVVHNAIKAIVKAEKPNGTVTVHAARSVDGFVKLRVEDNGPGFSSELLDTAHLPFRTTDKECNLGLGLTFAREVALRSGGSLAYGNNPSGGAWVALTLKDALLPSR